MNKTLKPVLLLAGALAAFGVGLALQNMVGGRQEAPDVPGLLWPPGPELAGFELLDQHGERFDKARLEGQWTLLFFGFTNCPDVCPATLQVMDSASRRLLAAGFPAGQLQVVMVSVDPERDTPEQLARYLAYFNEDFLGLTGSDEHLQTLTSQLGALYVREAADDSGNYSVDHTAALFLIDPGVRRLGVFSAPHEPADIAERIRAIHAFMKAS